MMISTNYAVAAGCIVFLFVIFFAERVLFGLAAYHDARSKENPDALIWGLVVGFIGVIPGIVYLCVRNTSRRLTACKNCGFLHDAADLCCPRCGACTEGMQNQAEDPYAPVMAHQAKREFIAAAILVGVVAFILISLLFTFFVGASVGFMW